MVIISTVVSIIISILIGNIVGIYYLNKLDRDWEIVFKKMKEIYIEEIKKYTHR